MKILGIESTCDETGAAIVENGKSIISSVVASSSLMHKKFGGVVPEVAARDQIRVIIPTIAQSITKAGLNVSDIDFIGVASAPGLIGSLLIGVETAKVLALAWKKPLISVNHLLGHIYANWLETTDSKKITVHSKQKNQTPNNPQRNPVFPLVALIVSGGHTDLILMINHSNFRWLGGTKDDAAGEVFDKVARTLGLKYPGGPEIERVAQQLITDKFSGRNNKSDSQLTLKLPRPMINEDSFDFSFSGLKTAVVNYVGTLSDIKSQHRLSRGQVSTIAAEFQKAIVDVLVKKTLKAASKFKVKSIVIGGGVAANQFLRQEFKDRSLKLNIPIFFPSKELSVDNGAMIATAAFFQKNFVDPLSLSSNSGKHF